MIDTARREFKRGPNIVCFQVGVLREDFFVAHSGRKQIQDVAHSEAQTPNAGAPATLSWFRRYALKEVAHARDDNTSPELPKGDQLCA